MNQIFIAGHLGHKAQLKTMPDGDACLEFSVADSLGKNKDAQWYRCEIFGKRAEMLAQYLDKGTPVAVTGRLEMRVYQGRDGETRAALNVRVSEVTMLGRAEKTSGAQTPAQKANEQTAAIWGAPPAQTYADVKGRVAKTPAPQSAPAQTHDYWASDELPPF